MRIPRISCDAAEPVVAIGKRAQCEFRDQHCPSFIQPLYNRRILLNDLLFESTRAPRGWIAFYG